MYHEDKDHLVYLRLMLAELLEKESSPFFSSADKLRFRRGSDALKRAIESMDSQVYA